ncbi:MAG TPA: PEP-CTERM sorting domain-containing protein [Burkholderiaceae bacterium]|nr:PEP-CTERM sorting domain-containing protein [Burkholderiaceae bacterium]
MNARLLALLAIFLIACTATPTDSRAAAITYTFTVSGCDPLFTPTETGGTCATGTIDGTSFSISRFNSSTLTFTYTGDTANILPWSLDAGTVSGYELLGGVATVSLFDSNGALLVTDTFTAADQMFVDIHNQAYGIGLGSGGAAPSDPSFPGDPSYPVGFYNSALTTYNMATSIGPLVGSANNCSGPDFPSSCLATAPSLALTSGGSFLFNTPYPIPYGDFSGTFSAAVAASTVPEPGTLGLVGIALAGAAAAVRRRQHKR